LHPLIQDERWSWPSGKIDDKDEIGNDGDDTIISSASLMPLFCLVVHDT
jgi:hypothetical protein